MLSCKSAAGDTQLAAIMQKYSKLHQTVIMVKNVENLTVLIVTLLPTSAAPVVVSAIASDAQKAGGDALCCACSVGPCLHYAALCIEEQLEIITNAGWHKTGLQSCLHQNPVACELPHLWGQRMLK